MVRRRAYLKKGALSHIVWTIIGIIMSIIVGTIVYTTVSSNIAASAQLSVTGMLVVSNELVVELRNIGFGTITITQVRLVDYNDRDVRDCRLTRVEVGTLTARLPLTLKSGDIAKLYFSGRSCRNVYKVIVYTDKGVYKGIVQE